jgi:predicted DNA-binding helix-hairpin-helix protein
MNERVLEKLSILADAAKYDVSCSSSGSKRKNENKGLGNAEGMGICHAYTEDGRCVSLLKILLTNHCIFDCAYCVSRKSNDVKRAAFTVQEVVDLTINFYQEDVLKPMAYLKTEIIANTEERTQLKKAPLFAPAGQSTQMVIGATPETDYQVLNIANSLYKGMNLKRVYYSGYVPISNDNRLPAIGTPVPMIRENRLYQADWLLRFYGFGVDELISQDDPHLDMQIDPKLNWALKNLDQFPLDINKADREMIQRVPGIGVESAKKIVEARRFSKLNWDHLKKLNIAANRAKYFLSMRTDEARHKDYSPQQIKNFILSYSQTKYAANHSPQLNLF